MNRFCTNHRVISRIRLSIVTVFLLGCLDSALMAQSIQQDSFQSSVATQQQLSSPPASQTPITPGADGNFFDAAQQATASQSTLNIWEPPEFFANPNINITPLESPPRFDAIDMPNYQLFKKRLAEQRGFDYLLMYTPLFQLGEGGQDYMDAELDFGFVWNLYDRGGSKGNLLAYGLWVQTFSNMPTGEYSQQYGVVVQPNSGGTDPNSGLVQLNLLAWEQTWRDDSISLRVGQLRNDFFFGTNKYHNDDRYVFLNTTLSGLHGINWAATGKGIGAMLDLRGDEFYSTFGFSDAKARQNYPDVQSFFDGRYHYIGEVGWTPKFGDNEGEYKVTVSATSRTGDAADVTQKQGYGLILGARQDIHERVGLSARWNKSFERFSGGLQESMVAGFTFTGVGRHKDDWISLGWFYGNPTDRSLNEESGMEIYWRAQLTKTIELTPDFQVYFDRAGQPGPAYFGALRIRFVF